MFPLVLECEAFWEGARLRLVTLNIRGNDVGTRCLEYEQEARTPEGKWRNNVRLAMSVNDLGQLQGNVSA